MVGRTLLVFSAVWLLGVADARAEYRQVELAIFGMD